MLISQIEWETYFGEGIPFPNSQRKEDITISFLNFEFPNFPMTTPEESGELEQYKKIVMEQMYFMENNALYDVVQGGSYSIGSYSDSGTDVKTLQKTSLAVSGMMFKYNWHYMGFL